MKRLTIVACVLSLFAVGCDEKLNPVTPTGLVTLVSQLSASQVLPPPGAQGIPAGALEAGAVGTLQITMAPSASGNYTASFTFRITGLVKAGLLPAPLDSGSAIVAGFIFPGAAGGPATGLPVTQLPISVAAPVLTPTGGTLLTFENVTVPAAAATAILANPSGFFFSLHSALNQAGVLRGQLVKQ
jgi:hypothetical protein